MTATSSARSVAARTTAPRLSRLPIRTSSQRSAAVTIVRVPFVVERISVSAFGSRNSRGEAPTSKPSIRTASRSPPTTLSGSSARSARACSISGTQSTRRYPDESACAIVEVARITSTTIPVGAEAASSGVNAT